MGIDLPLLWFLIIGFGIMMYVITDGFDLGIGILFPLVAPGEHRDTMVNTVAPVWDGNETWLAFGGAGLLAAFPKAYAILLSAFYIPAILMLVGLIWRGVSFEFRFKADDAHKPLWDKAFMLGSFVAAFFQGVMLGGFIQGVEVNPDMAGYKAMSWLSPFSLFTGLGVIVAYALLGATWLVLKTEGELQKNMIRFARPVTWAFLVIIAAVSVWTPLAHPEIAIRWFSFPDFWFLAPVPLLVVFAAWQIMRCLGDEPHSGPFMWSLLLIFLGYSGFVISIWPHIVPPSMTIHEAAAPAQSLGFTLVGALLVIPVILGYSAWSYFVFRGKVRPGEAYQQAEH